MEELRLTDKYINSWDVVEYYTSGKLSSGIVYIDENKNWTNMAIGKLGRHEDIEEKIGIDLVTLFTAYFNGFHIKYEDGLRGFVKGGEYFLEMCLQTGAFIAKAFPNGTKWYFKDYGKTWALTKEELK